MSARAAEQDAPTKRARFFHFASAATLLALLALTIAWELVLAPLRPGGSWIALKGLPLLLPLRGVLTGAVYTYRWSIMLVTAYFAEGCVRAYAEQPPASMLALLEVALSAAYFAAAIAYVRARRR